MIQFACEPYRVVWQAGESGIFKEHWEELAIDKVIPLELNHEMYEEFERKDMLHVVTARSGDRLVGYYVAILGPHLHYKSAGVMAYTDMYYILPEFRKFGAHLFMFVEDSLRERGIKKVYLSCKVHRNHSELFLGLGYRNTDLGFSKFFGEAA